MKLIFKAVLCLSMCIVPISTVNNRLKEVFAWKFIDYAWEKPEDRDAAIASGEFVPENNLPLGLEVWKDKLFITIPRWKNGVVSTLNYVKITDDEITATTLPSEATDESDTSKLEDETETRDTELTTPTTPVTSAAEVITREDLTSTKYEETSPLSASILPMPARSLGELMERYRRATREDDELQISSFLKKSFEKNSNRKNKDKKQNQKEDKDGEEKYKNKEKEKKNKDKKKKKKKCKPKPKPTTPVPPPLAPETTSSETETTDATTGIGTETETTAHSLTPRSPALIPYPSFAANKLVLKGEKKVDEPAPIVSVFRVWADFCDRLWIMDTGVADILGKTTVVSKPRIVIYNLNNDKLIKTFEFRDSDSEEHSFFANIIVDTDPENCDKAFAYVPDLGGYGIVSYDFANDKTRRIKHNYFHFDPLAGNMEVGGVNFQWTDGVFSIALTKLMEDGFRQAYFHCLASTKEFSVSTKILKSEDDSKSSYYDYKLVGDRGEKSQSSASYIHEDTGIMFYTQLQKDSVNCWNTNKPLTPENLVEVASDNETMIFTNDLKVDKEGNLWVLTDKLPVFIYRGLDDSEVNYRIFTATVEEAVSGTNCVL